MREARTLTGGMRAGSAGKRSPASETGGMRLALSSSGGHIEPVLQPQSRVHAEVGSGGSYGTVAGQPAGISLYDLEKNRDLGYHLAGR